MNETTSPAAEPTGLRPPVPLRAFLEAGGDLREALGGYFDLLVEILWETEDPGEWRTMIAGAERRFTAEILDDPELYIRAKGSALAQSMLLCSSRQADVLEDPSLRDLVIEQLGPAERAKLDNLILIVRSPHPLGIVRGLEEPWTCSSCGSSFEAGAANAVVIGTRDDPPCCRFEHPMRYCPACIEEVAVLLGVRRPGEGSASPS